MKEKSLISKILSHPMFAAAAVTSALTVDYLGLGKIENYNRIIKAEVIDVNSDGLKDIIHTYENGSKVVLYAQKSSDGKIFYSLDEN